MSKLVSWILEFNLDPGGVIHVGAHAAQEAADYAAHDLEPVIWFEAIPQLVERANDHLASFPRQNVLQALLWSEPGLEKEFKIASNDQGSSSVFDFYFHSASYPHIKMNQKINLITTTLDLVLPEQPYDAEGFPYLVLDVQGAELEVLKGSRILLKKTDVIMTEVSTRELYKNAPLYGDMIKWLEIEGFTLIADDLNLNLGWGDALFMRSSLFSDRYSWIKPLSNSTYNTPPSKWVFLRGILVRFGIRPEILSRKFITELFKK